MALYKCFTNYLYGRYKNDKTLLLARIKEEINYQKVKILFLDKILTEVSSD